MYQKPPQTTPHYPGTVGPLPGSRRSGWYAARIRGTGPTRSMRGHAPIFPSMLTGAPPRRLLARTGKPASWERRIGAL